MATATKASDTVPTPASLNTTIGASIGGFKIKGQVSLPFIKMAQDVGYIVRFNGPIIPGAPKLGPDGKPVIDPESNLPLKQADMANVTIFNEAGTESEDYQTPIVTVLRSELEKKFTGADGKPGYVGKTLYLKNLGKVPGKKYMAFTILELSK